MWFMWIERNNHIHNNTPFSIVQVEQRVVLHLQNATRAGILTKKQWVGCSPSASPLLNMAGLQPIERPRPVLWKRPQPSWCKLNTDGTFTPAAEKSGGGGIIRDEYGDIITGFYQPLTADSSIEAELLALAKGLELAIEV